MMVLINNYNVMKQIILILIACLSFSNIDAQDKKLQKQIDGLKRQKTELEAVLNSINTEIALIENRSFSRETPEQSLKRRLSFYRNIAELSKKMKKDINSSSSLIRSYSFIIAMYESVLKTGGYDKTQNELFKNQIEPITYQVQNLDPHHADTFIESFEKLATQIKDYRFTMFELIRVFDLVDESSKKGIEPDEIRSSLRADEETEFIDKIPYTQELLRKYIYADDMQRLDIRKSEAFMTIK